MGVAAKISTGNAAKAPTQVPLTMATGKNAHPAKPSELSETRRAHNAGELAGSLREN
jgi:hypothetical protein